MNYSGGASLSQQRQRPGAAFWPCPSRPPRFKSSDTLPRQRAGPGHGGDETLTIWTGESGVSLLVGDGRDLWRPERPRTGGRGATSDGASWSANSGGAIFAEQGESANSGCDGGAGAGSGGGDRLRAPNTDPPSSIDGTGRRASRAPGRGSGSRGRGAGPAVTPH
ncbi:glycine-rich cell wall structural protein 1.0-like [Schistocerca piceifrons]|uniref:glycine-rich cell wall structural protein 1.0-like n=1 Tax=Schistocerca piceifrons TaxID=274613 RepID=UPI001F5F8765|nr:glycine-rich cell wall structural protein 1.0-like [Schistocerca piceifrons]